ncbi:MAG: hypothetical protein OD918_00015 [Gammaproteobacteria bacterium]
MAKSAHKFTPPQPSMPPPSTVPERMASLEMAVQYLADKADVALLAQKVTGVDERVARVEEKVEQVGEKVAQVSERVARIEVKLDGIAEGKADKVDIEKLRADMQAIETRSVRRDGLLVRWFIGVILTLVGMTAAVISVGLKIVPHLPAAG